MKKGKTMTALLKEYGMTILSVIISILLILMISNKYVAKNIGTNVPEVVKMNMENGKKKINSIPKYDDSNIQTESTAE